MRTDKRFSLSTTQIILLSFLLVILVGSLLLSLPVSSANGQGIPYVDALFTATTATCVTGLVTVTTAAAWSTFGHVVILLLIQIGGLGVITVVSWLMLLMNRKLGLKGNLLLQDAFNLNSLSGLSKFVKKVVLGTLAVEGVGAALYMLVFIPQFGLRGVWISVFTAVSAFCNAGIDILGDSSLCAYATHPLINFVTMSLIILGGLGYIVWWDLARVWRQHPRRRWRHLTLHSKIVLSTTALLIFGGAALIFAAEYHNPATIGTMSLWDKIQVSLFQSVTTRTAGFASVPQEHLTGGGSLVSLVLMFVGGSPVGTAGGIKTTTLAVLAASAFSTITGRNQVSLHQRRLSSAILHKAVAVAGMSLTILFLSTLGLALVTDAPLGQILYETTSATATVGLTQNLTPLLNNWGKAIIIATMYFGRIGPISLAIALGTRKESRNNIQDPIEDISVG